MSEAPLWFLKSDMSEVRYQDANIWVQTKPATCGHCWDRYWHDAVFGTELSAALADLLAFGWCVVLEDVTLKGSVPAVAQSRVAATMKRSRLTDLMAQKKSIWAI